MTAWLLALMLLAASGDGWSNLKHVVRNRPYAVIADSESNTAFVAGLSGEVAFIDGATLRTISETH